jgi:hypothetical protein
MSARVKMAGRKAGHFCRADMADRQLEFRKSFRIIRVPQPRQWKALPLLKGLA